MDISWNDKIKRLVETTAVPGKNIASNALYHLKKAHEIKDIDPTMAGFRAITAEEEAATAIFHALKRRQYEYASQLNHWNHRHKSAVYPFIQAIGKALSPMLDKVQPQLEVNINDKMPLLRIRFLLTYPDGKQEYGYPDPPLHYIMYSQDGVYDFSKELEQIATDRGAKSIIKYCTLNLSFNNLSIAPAFRPGAGKPSVLPSLSAALRAAEREGGAFSLIPRPEGRGYSGSCRFC